jgi:Na+/H+ antiporter NhaA
MQQRPDDRDYALQKWFWGDTAIGELLDRLAQKLKDQGDDRTAFGIAIGLRDVIMPALPRSFLVAPWLAVRASAAALPRGVLWSHVSIVGMVGGIGFTMALFIAQLAFATGSLLENAKLGILCGSALAGSFSLFAGYRVLQIDSAPGMAIREAEAEGSTWS